MKKKNYEIPLIEFHEMRRKDIIATSGGIGFSDSAYNYGNSEEDWINN